MRISHVHCRVKDLLPAVEWFASKCGVVPSFSDARMTVLEFGPFTLILDAASDDSVATIGFNSPDCDADFATMVARGARVVQPPQDRPYGASPICKGPAHSQSSLNNSSLPPMTRHSNPS